jgi:hypothetical protein
MPTPMTPVAGAIRVTLLVEHEGSVMENVVHYKLVDTSHIPSESELLSFAAGFWTAVNAAYTAASSVSYNFKSVVARYLGSTTGPEAEYNIPQPHPGTAGGDAAPANCACVISWKTPLVGKSYRGRTYVMGMVDTHPQGSNLTVGYGALAAAIAVAISSFVSSGSMLANLGILSRKKNIITVATAWVIDGFVDSMRTRLIGRGR